MRVHYPIFTRILNHLMEDHPDGGNIRHDSFDVPATDDDDEDEERSLSSSNFFQGVQSEDGSWRPGHGIIPCRGPVQPRYFTKGTPRNELYEEIPVTDFQIEKMKETICSICQCEYVRGETRIFLPCTHYFHSNCIKRWLPREKKSGCWTTVAGKSCPCCNDACL